jgi:hypothetical protein
MTFASTAVTARVALVEWYRALSAKNGSRPRPGNASFGKQPRPLRLTSGSLRSTAGSQRELAAIEAQPGAGTRVNVVTP